MTTDEYATLYKKCKLLQSGLDKNRKSSSIYAFPGLRSPDQLKIVREISKRGEYAIEDERERVVYCISEYFELTKEQLTSERRFYPIPIARALVCYCLYQIGSTLMSLGGFLNKDHSTIIYNKRRIEQLREIRDKKVLHYIEDITNKYPCMEKYF